MAADPTDPKPKRRRSRWLLRIAGVLLALLLGTELVLRLVGGPVFGVAYQARGMFSLAGDSFQLQPGFRGEQTILGRTTTIRVNATGLRGPELSPKRTGERRVLVVGDSMVFGQGVAEAETIPAQLQRRLGQVTVGNGGVSGYGSRDMAAAVQRLRSFDADVLVVCTFLGNDFLEDCRRHVDVVAGFRFEGRVARTARESWRFWLALHSRTALLFERAVVATAPGFALNPLARPFTAEEIEACRGFPTSRLVGFAGLFVDKRDPAHLVVTTSLRRWRESCARIRASTGGRPVLFVVIPSWWHLSRENWLVALEKARLAVAEHEFGVVQKRLREAAQEDRFELLDLTPLLRSADDPDSLWIHRDGHLSAHGCAQVAAWLQPHVEKLLGR